MAEQEHYKKADIDAFEDWEPYWCGLGAPTKDFYRPLNETDKTPMYQAYTDNGFTEKVSSSFYNIDNKPIYGAKKGTCPKAGNYAGASNPNPIASGTTSVEIWKDASGIHVGSTIITEAMMKSRGAKGLPKWMGLVLVGGGGGAGGRSWFDVDKDGDGKSDHYAVPGAGGGGGGIAVMEINLDATNNVFKYKITVGNGGTVGKSRNDAGIDYNHPNIGYTGTSGGPTYLYYGSTILSAFVPVAVLAVAYGGKAGKGGNWHNVVSGGEGGSAVVYDLVNEGLVHKEATYKGGAGCECSQNDPKAPALNIDITFLADEANGKYTTERRNPELPGTILDRSKLQPKDLSAKGAGGNSYGGGSYPKTNTKPNMGGGGASYSEAEGEETLTEYGNGSVGFYALFY